MNSTILIIALALGIGTAYASNMPASGRSELKEIAMATQTQHLPSAVIDKIIKDFPGYLIQSYTVKRSDDGRKTLFEVSLRNISNSEVCITFTENGHYEN